MLRPCRVLVFREMYNLTSFPIRTGLVLNDKRNGPPINGVGRINVYWIIAAYYSTGLNSVNSGGNVSLSGGVSVEGVGVLSTLACQFNVGALPSGLSAFGVHSSYD